MMNSKEKLPEMIQALMEEKGASLEKLAYATNIPQRFLIALRNGEFNKLPAKPYVRGYLLKIAAALGADPEAILQAYKESTEIRGSGVYDKLPSNRFVIQKFNKNLVLILLILVGLAVFLGFRMKSIIGTPTITVSIPESTLVTKGENLKVWGKISPGDHLTLNREIIYTNDDGSFEKEVKLSPGLNVFEFEAKRFLGRSTKITRQAFYEH